MTEDFDMTKFEQALRDLDWYKSIRHIEDRLSNIGARLDLIEEKVGEIEG